jgi:sterol desaturase/sphingolipid hydroxylase (fatty acid hydroxylase superfamily)
MKNARQQHQSIQIFKNPFMEKWLTHVHPATPLVVWAPILAYFVYRSIFILQISALAFIGMAFAGLLIWSFTEYVMHRFVFHFVAHGPFQERIRFLIHGVHHDDPVDPTRLVMPPILSITLGIGLFMIFRTIFGPVWVYPFFVFFIVGYLCYDYTHYAIHHFNMKSNWGKMVKKHHMLHHYATHEAKWGVSSPFWDHVFKTVEEARVEKSGKTEAAASH